MAWVTRRDVTIVVAGVAMMSLALYIAVRFTEQRFVPVRTGRWSSSWTTFRRGLTLVRRSREILLILAATFLVNGAWGAAGRLIPKRLLDLGLPSDPDPIIWFTGLGVIGLILGALALRVVGQRIDGAHARNAYALAAAAGVLGMLLLAFACDPVAGAVALVLVSGIVNPLTRLISAIWVNARTTADIRATTHSFLAQLKYLGEIVCGLGIAAIAGLTSLPLALATCAALFAATAVLMSRQPTKALRR